ncbi:MAG: glycosyltransferase family 4 protein [Candidatus Magasanikbacteria bacterium]|nr:glycosyltransferase family 4 protein [Candidatus Magasanikbacteria bacterium]
MKIGIDASRANNLQKTGVEWYAFNTIQELKKIIPSSEKVVLYTNKPLTGDLSELPENWEEKVLNWFLGRFWTQIRLSLEMIFYRPDVLFIPAHVFPFIHPKKTVMTVHDIAAYKFPESYSKFERWYSLWSAKKAVKKLWKVFVPSEFVKKELIEVYGDKNVRKIIVIPHGVSDNFEIKKDKSRIDFVLSEYGIKSPYILSIGRIETKKNTLRIVEAFEKLKKDKKMHNLSLVLVGKNGFGYEKILKKIDKSENKKDIKKMGWVDSKDLPLILRGAEVFVFPSVYEGFGLPVLEAFSAEVPTVISKGNSLEELSNGASLLCDMNNSESISGAVKMFLVDGELRKKNVKLGLARVKFFSWEKSAKEVWHILNS